MAGQAKTGSRSEYDCLTFPRRGSSRFMDLEPREMAFEGIMDEFIILSKPSPRMLSNLFLNA